MNNFRAESALYIKLFFIVTAIASIALTDVPDN